MPRPKKQTVAMNKSEMLVDIADNTGLSRKEVSSALDGLAAVIGRHIQKGAVGYVTVPGLMKIKAVTRPAQKAKKGVPNPFRPGELMDVKAKPASSRIKILPLKKLKDMV